jgi:hypothetical protein
LLAAPASFFALASACGDTPATGADPSAQKDAAAASDTDGSTPDVTDATNDAGKSKPDGGGPGDSGAAACNPPSGLGRGLTWVRENPMMISGLSTAMGSPSAQAVTEYFDGFHATAAHVWENGLPAEIAGFAAANHPGFRYVSWVHRDGTSLQNSQVLGGAPSLPGRIGYQIGDEPVSSDALQEILAGAAVVKGADPAGLRIINLNDTDGANDLRTQAAQAADIDVLSYDHYTWATSAQNGLMSTRTAALAAGKPYWRYIRSFYYKDDGPSGTASDLRWDALVGAVYGFSGNSWFVYSIEASNADIAPLLFATGGDYAAAKTSLYEAAANANLELAQIGRTLVLLRSTDVRYVASISLLKPSALQAWAKGAGNDPYLSGVSLGGPRDLLVGHFRDDCDEPYIMVQNQAHAGGTIPNNSSGSDTFTLSFDFAGATDSTLDKTAVLALDTATGAVASRPLSSTGATTAQLVVDLPAGAVFFFKYKNARPFVRQ